MARESKYRWTTGEDPRQIHIDIEMFRRNARICIMDQHATFSVNLWNVTPAELRDLAGNLTAFANELDPRTEPSSP